MKKIISILLALLTTTISFAQGDTTGRSELTYLFQPLNANNIPTGYLMEWGTDMTDKDDLNGQITDSNFVNSMDLLRMVYSDIYSAKYKTTAITLPSVDELNNAINAANTNSLVLVYGQYATFDPYALQTGKVNFTNGRIYQAGTASPYLQKQVFAAFPKQAVFTNTATLRYNTALYYNNTGVTVNNVQINWGAGFVSAPANTNVSYTYTDSTGPKIVKIKVQFSNGQILQTQILIKVVVSNPGGNSARYADVILGSPDITIPALNGVHSGCKIYIRRSINTPNGQLLKPLIMVEGLDVGSALPDIYENYNPNQIISNINEVKDTNFNLSTKLDSIAGYDLVLIDWINGVGDITGNAKCLEQALDAIQALKNNSSQNNVIVGISMGGLISRYCLADMVKRTPRKATNTSLLITMDSPHQGAYVPLAFQHLIMTLPDAKGPMGIRFGSIMSNALDKVKNNLLLSAGAQQQLKLLVTNTTGTVAQNTFLTNIYRPKITFTNPSMQPEYDFRALSNGSQCGKNVMSPGASLVAGTASANASGAVITLQLLSSWLLTGTPFTVITKLKYKADLNANALNGISNHEILFFKLKREEKLFFVINNNKTFVEIKRNETTINSTPWESVPGGTQSLGDRLNIKNTGLSENWSVIAPWFLGYNYSITMAPVWSFVPVTSALDIQNPSSQNVEYIFPTNGQNGSTATRYIAQETTLDSNNINIANINHTDFTPRNAKWLYEELAGISHTTDCNDVCIAALTISGPSEACSGTYSVPSIAGATYVWQVSPAGAIYLTPLPSSNSISISNFNNSYKQYTVSVIVYTAQGNYQCIYGQGSKVVQLGLKPPYLAGPFDPLTYQELIAGYTNVNYYFEAQESSSINGPFTYSWTLRPPNNGTVSYYSGQSPTITFPTTGNYTLSLKKQSSSCGNVTVTRTIVVQPNYGGLTVFASPNPANTNVDITYIEYDTTSSSNASKSMGKINPVTISVYDMQGAKVLYWKEVNENHLRFDVSGLPNGMYIIEVINQKGKKGNCRFLIQH